MLIFFLIIAVMAINPLMYFEKGILIKNVEENSTAQREGFVKGEIIKEINSQKILTLEDYGKIMNSTVIEPVEFSVLTDEGIFVYESRKLDFDVEEKDNDVKTDGVNITAVEGDIIEINNNSRIVITNAYGNASEAGLKPNMTLLMIDDRDITSAESFEKARDSMEPKVNMIIKTERKDYTLSLNKPLEVTVGEIPSSNIKTGIDLRGGARGMVKPVEKVSSKDIDDLILVSKERFNVYGIADISIKPVTDLSGNNYMLVEVAGATQQDIKELIGKQGKFEAKIGNKTVFAGGKNDIPSVCRNDAQCARIERCVPVEGGYSCEFVFSIYLSETAAEKQANITANLEANRTESGKKYLNESLDLYLDDRLVDSLLISYDLKGKPATQIAISGPGVGLEEAEAYENAQKNMLKLQTVLITGSLPFKLEVVKLDNISPLLGKEFTKNIVMALFAVIISVSAIVAIRYKKISLVIPVIITILSEILLVLGVASLISWNIDVASIAGIIASVGTGVDDQIVIIDESRISKQYSWKERIRRAFSIILGAFATVVVALLPLWWAGAGLLKGFALTTILGICVGVFITRPAFADIISQLSKD